MTNQFFDLDPQSKRDAQSEPEMQALFAHYFPIEPLPTAFAMQLRERVLAEVAVVIKPTRAKTPLVAKWLWTRHKGAMKWLIMRLWLLVLTTLFALWLATTLLLDRIDPSQDN
jgi:hypothetical protein